MPDSFLGNMYNFPSSNSSSNASYTSDGYGNLVRQGGSNSGGPSLDQYYAGLMHDLTTQQNVNDQNFNRGNAAANMFLSRGTEAANRFINPQTNGQAFFDEARGFAERGYKDASKRESKTAKDLKAAAGKQSQGHAAAMGMYNKAIANMSPEAAAARYAQAEQEAETKLKANTERAVTERVDAPEKIIPAEIISTTLDDSANKIASAMNAAAARKAQDDYSQNYGQYDGGVGTESQFQDLMGANRRNVENSIFQATSQLQGQQAQFNANQQATTNQLNAGNVNRANEFNAGRVDRANEFNAGMANQTSQINAAQTNRNNEAIYGTHMAGQQYDLNVRTAQSQLMAGQGNLMGQLADSAASFAATSANIGLASGQSKDEFSKLSSQIAMNNATMNFQNNSEYMQGISFLGQSYVQMVDQFKMQGVAVVPTMIAMGEAARRFGGGGGGGAGSGGPNVIQNPIQANNNGGAFDWMQGSANLRKMNAEGQARGLAYNTGVNYIPGGGKTMFDAGGMGGGGQQQDQVFGGQNSYTPNLSNMYNPRGLRI